MGYGGRGGSGPAATAHRGRGWLGAPPGRRGGAGSGVPLLAGGAGRLTPTPVSCPGCEGALGVPGAPPRVPGGGASPVPAAPAGLPPGRLWGPWALSVTPCHTPAAVAPSRPRLPRGAPSLSQSYPSFSPPSPGPHRWVACASLTQPPSSLLCSPLLPQWARPWPASGLRSSSPPAPLSIRLRAQLGNGPCGRAGRGRAVVSLQPGPGLTLGLACRRLPWQQLQPRRGGARQPRGLPHPRPRQGAPQAP